MASEDETVSNPTTPDRKSGASTALLRRRATRRAVLAGGVAAAGVAGAYAAMGDRLHLFGDSGGPELEAVRSDTSAINKESVKINHLLRRAGFGVTKEEYDRYQQIGLKTSIEELLAYNAVDDSEAEKAQAEANTLQPNGQQRYLPNTAWLARIATTKRP